MRFLGFDIRRTAKRSIEAAGDRGPRPKSPNSTDDYGWTRISGLTSGAVDMARADEVARRAQLGMVNNAVIARAATSFRNAAWGFGASARPVHANKTIAAMLATEWRKYQRAIYGKGNFATLGAHVCLDYFVNGGALLIRNRDKATGMPNYIRSSVQLLDGTKIKSGPDIFITGGIEHDASTLPLAYHIRPDFNGIGTAGTSRRYPAEDVIHVYDQLFAGQQRGLSKIAPVYHLAMDTEGLADSAVVGARSRSNIVFSVYTDADETGFDGAAVADVSKMSAEPGTLNVLPPGKRWETHDPKPSTSIPEELRAFLRMTAAGVDTPYEVLSGDYSQTNYSGARAGMLDYRRSIETFQFTILEPLFLNAVWSDFLKFLMLKGKITATEFKRDPEAFGVTWIFPAWPAVDPFKEANALIALMKSGLRSRADIVAELGFDIANIDTEFDQDKILKGLLKP